ncbi:MAG TPA: hypothetical protein VMU14_10725, partial [Acidimicrobiales bacterium]|nr:hypothetical protein [Acidimicrobiales bacterium]
MAPASLATARPSTATEENLRRRLTGIDLASLAAGFGAALRAAGVAVAPDRSARFAAAVTLVEPASLDGLYWCARVTLLTRHEDIDAFDRVFAHVFRGIADVADQRGDPATAPARARPRPAPASAPPRSATPPPGGGTTSASAASGDDGREGQGRDVPLALAAPHERLAH